ncbi:HvfA family oxazolone/thioamide-modified RiPP metallophore [Aquipseudomonas alcaligenes]
MAITLGAALLGSTFVAQAGGNPFASQELSSGYSLAAHEKGHEGACGEGKCGGEMKAEEGKCGGDKASKEGKCGGDKAKKEGSCGEEAKAGHEGKCGGDKAE